MKCQKSCVTIRGDATRIVGADIDNVPHGRMQSDTSLAMRIPIIPGTGAFALCARSSAVAPIASTVVVPRRSHPVVRCGQRALRCFVLGLAVLLPFQASWAADDGTMPQSTASAAMGAHEIVETIVLMRHGEKPREGFGQLNCQGLNRSLALPKVLQAKYGRPDLIIAPNPAILKADWGRSYAYVRPLATIEPTAIANGMPVDVALGYEDQDALVDRLLSPGLEGKTVFVAWEHRIAEKVAKALLTRVGAPADTVPHWSSGDYDSLYVVRVIGRAGQGRTATFTLDHQQLNGVATRCP